MALGRLLNADPILSGNDNISCATCHQPAMGGDDDRPTAIGQGATGVGMDRSSDWPGEHLARNTPALVNIYALPVLFWDGRVTEHEDGSLSTNVDSGLSPELSARLRYGALSVQAMVPLTVEDEMAGFLGENEIADDAVFKQYPELWAAITHKVVAVEAYRPWFEEAYPEIPFEDVTIAEIADAIAAMETAAYTMTDSPFDRFLAGDDTALDAAAVRGGLDFTDPAGANCVACHTGPALTDLDFHDTLLPQLGRGLVCVGTSVTGSADDPAVLTDEGRSCATLDAADLHRFRTAPLRGLAVSAPYGHAGQYRDLGAYLSHYIDPETDLATYDPAVDQDDPGLDGALLHDSSDILAHADPLLGSIHLTATQIPDLVAFLGSMDDARAQDLGDWLPEAVPSGLPVDRPLE